MRILAITAMLVLASTAVALEPVPKAPTSQSDDGVIRPTISEVDQLKLEIQRLKNEIADLKKKLADTQAKAIAATKPASVPATPKPDNPIEAYIAKNNLDDKTAQAMRDGKPAIGLPEEAIEVMFSFWKRKGVTGGTMSVESETLDQKTLSITINVWSYSVTIKDKKVTAIYGLKNLVEGAKAVPVSPGVSR